VARELLAGLAEAAGLREGPRGVEEVLRHLAAQETAATRDLSRHTGIPVPVVAAVCGELRRAGLLAGGRPARLSPSGRELAGRLLGPRAPCRCAACGGLGVVLPAGYAALAPGLGALLGGVPPADPALDQAHCTVESKLRRVAYLQDAGALSGRSLLLLGDDDQMAVAIAYCARELGILPPARLAVVDVDPAVVEFARATVERLGVATEPVVHDVRRPLPGGLLAGFDAVFTDPPYTVPGAELFMSRAAAALRPGPGGQAFLCLGPRPPEEGARILAAVAGMGFALHRLLPNFNEYLGAGVLAGTSHLHHLVGGPRVTPSIAAEHDAALYTGDVRRPLRTYRCRSCGARHTVGAGERWPTIGDLRRQGCPACAGTVFRPGRRGSS
jgi:predicted methyltransferase